jgi:hypothetical protein
MLFLLLGKYLLFMIIDVRQSTAKKGAGILAQWGLIAKGFVYVLLGVLALMAAFHIGAQRTENADRTGVFNFLSESSGGKWLLPVLAVGLLCYSIWRFLEAAKFAKGENKKWKKAARYLLSGLLYLSIALSAFKIVFHQPKKNEDSQQQFASELLSKPFGQWLLGIAALIIAAIGIYQIYYAVSEKYKDHVQKMNLHTKASSLMLMAGKIGYLARGAVWLIIAYLMLQAAFAASAAKAGDTGEAFNAIEDSAFGSFLPGALGVGLIAYGLFNFVRARYERFE